MNANEIFTEATYVQPVPEYDYNEIEIAAKDVKVGDLLNNGTVTEVKIGRKWAYLTVQFPMMTKVAEIELQVVVRVARKTRTEDSSALARRAYTNGEISKIVTQRAGATDAALAAVAADISRCGAAGYNELSNLMAAQAKRALLTEFVGFSTNGHAVFEDAVAAKQAFIEVLKARLASDTFRALSRSTSVVSNLLDDVRRETELRFVADSRWDI